jgi:holo-[acyl-carrier protein] synthase
MIKGVGIDIIDVPRFKKVLERWGNALTARLFTRDELEYSTSQRRPECHLAARFAAKVGFMKAHGGFVSFKKIDITRDELGRPCMTVVGVADINIALTMSHDGGLAIAQVIITKQ